MRYKKLLSFVTFFIGLLYSPLAYAFIQDTEIDDALRKMCAPIFKAAGLNQNAVEFRIINSPTLNAFVQNGQTIYLHTGLITQTENIGQLIGVLAHETGHIQGGHVIGLKQAYNDSAWHSVLGMAVGIAAAAASGEAKAGVAAAAIGQDLARRSLMQHSRTHENAADQAGVRLMEQAGYSPQGLLDAMVLLNEKALYRVNDPYLLTHPLTDERIQNLKNFVERSSLKSKPYSLDFHEKYNRIRAKTIGFLYGYDAIKRAYPHHDKDFASKYAWAIMYFRQGRLEGALNIVDGLLVQKPNDGYLHELKGQILFENGHVARSIDSYEKALDLLPHASLVKLSYAHALTELKNIVSYQKAKKILKKIAISQKQNPQYWRLLSIVHAKTNEMGLAYLALAEKALLERDLKTAEAQAKRAQGMFPEYSKQWVQSQDILRFVKQQKK